MKTIRIFVSSPSDLAPERQISVQVIDRLHNEFKHFFDVKPVFWEHEPLLATEHFQEGLISPDQCDIMLCMLWSTLGSPLPDNFSRVDNSKGVTGTEWEFEKAKQHFEQEGYPKILFYRKTSKITVDIGDPEKVSLAQAKKHTLDAFFTRHFHNQDEEKTFKNAYWPFENLDDFENTIETHLRSLLKELASAPLSTPNTNQPAQDAITWHQGSPFRGLNSFDLEHAAIFFGRSRAKSQIFDQFSQQVNAGKPFLMTLGMSGSGKSSVIKAGVQPLLLSPKVIEGVAECRRATFKPSDSPGNLIEGIAKAIFSDTALPEATPDREAQESLLKQLRQSPHALETHIFNSLTFIKQLKQFKPIYNVKLLVVIDQFEELFTLPDISESDRHALISLIHSLVSSGHTWVLATMRSDFFAQCEAYPELIDLMLGNGQYHLAPPTGEEIEQMIVSPARAAGLSFAVNDDGVSLAQVLRERSSNQPSVLPLLSFTLDELYRRRDSSNLLTYDAYNQLGGLEGAIATRASTVFETLDEAQQQVFDELLPSLVTIHSENSDTVTARSVNMDFIESDPIRKSLVTVLVTERLLVSQGNRKSPENSTVRFTHEALLQNWSRVKEWVRFNLEQLKIRSRLASQARYWELSGNNSDELLAEGVFFDQVISLAKNKKLDLSELELSFINDSEKNIQSLIASRNLEVQKQQRFRQRLIAAGSIAAVFVCVFIYQVYSNQQVQRSLEENNALQELRMQDYVNGQLTKMAADELEIGNNEKAIELLQQTKPLEKYTPAYGLSRELLFQALNRKAKISEIPNNYAWSDNSLLLTDSNKKEQPYNLETNRYFLPRNTSFGDDEIGELVFFTSEHSSLVHNLSTSTLEEWDLNRSETRYSFSYSVPIISAHYLVHKDKWLIVDKNGKLIFLNDRKLTSLANFKFTKSQNYKFKSVENSNDTLLIGYKDKLIKSIWLVNENIQASSTEFRPQISTNNKLINVDWPEDTKFYKLANENYLVNSAGESLDLIDLSKGVYIDRLAFENPLDFSIMSNHLIFNGINGHKMQLSLNNTAQYYPLPIANGRDGSAFDNQLKRIYFINLQGGISEYSPETRQTNNHFLSSYKFEHRPNNPVRIAVNDNVILISDPATGLYCFNKNSKRLLWKKDIKGKLVNLVIKPNYALLESDSINIVDLETGEFRDMVFTNDDIVRFDETNGIIYTISDSSNFKIIDMLSGNILFSQTLDVEVTSIELLPNQKIMLKNGKRLYSFQRIDEEQKYSQQYTVRSDVNDLIFNYNVVVEVKDREVHFYDVNSNQLVGKWLAPGKIRKMKTDNDSLYLQIGDREIYRYSLTADKVTNIFSYSTRIQRFDIFESQKKLVVYDDENNLQIRSLENNSLVTLNHWSKLKDVFMQSSSLSNNQLVSLEENNSLNIWDITSGNLVNRVNIKGSIDKAAVSEDGVVFVTRYSEERSQLADELTNNNITILPHSINDISDVILASDYSTVAVILKNRNMNVYPLSSAGNNSEFILLPVTFSASNVVDAVYTDKNQSLLIASTDIQNQKDKDGKSQSVIYSNLVRHDLSLKETTEIQNFESEIARIKGVIENEPVVELEFSNNRLNIEELNAKSIRYDIANLARVETSTKRIINPRIDHLTLNPINTIALANLSNNSNQVEYIPLPDDLKTSIVVDIDTTNKRLLTRNQDNRINIWNYQKHGLIAEFQLEDKKLITRFESGGEYISLKGSSILAFQKIYAPLN